MGSGGRFRGEVGVTVEVESGMETDSFASLGMTEESLGMTEGSFGTTEESFGPTEESLGMTEG